MKDRHKYMSTQLKRHIIVNHGESIITKRSLQTNQNQLTMSENKVHNKSSGTDNRN